MTHASLFSGIGGAEIAAAWLGWENLFHCDVNAGTVFAILGAIIFFAVNRTNGIIVLIFAFLVSPLGLPMLAAWLIGKLQQLRYAIQDRVY